jgi:hypothetical protein
MAGRLVMSGDIGDWLRELAADEPARARAAAAALVAVLDAPDLASAPYVTSLAGPVAPAEPDSLDYLYQEALTALQRVRQEVANAATARSSIDQAIEALADAPDYGDITARLARLHEHREAASRREEAAAALRERLQARVDDFRTRKETAKASYTAAVASLRVREVLAELSPEELTRAEAEVADARARLEAAARTGRDLITRAGGRPNPEPGLLELNVGGLGDDQISILLAEEPAGTALLLAVLHGSEAIASHRTEAIALASDLLAALRASPDDQPGDNPMIEFDSAAAFVRGLFPGTADRIEAEAAALAGRLTLAQIRERLGISDDDMAERMRMSLFRLRDFEQTSLADQEPAQLSSYISALGGEIRHAVVINGERFDLR